MNEEQKFEDYRNRLNIRDVLTDAGYTLHKRDGFALSCLCASG